MYYCKSRYYNPEWCRWLTPDSIEYLDTENHNGLNLYCYYENNPILNVDYTGCWFITLTASTIAYLALALIATAATVAVIKVEKETHSIENALTAIFEGIEDGFESITDFVESLFTPNDHAIIQSDQNVLVNEFSPISVKSIDFIDYYVYKKIMIHGLDRIKKNKVENKKIKLEKDLENRISLEVEEKNQKKHTWSRT